MVKGQVFRIMISTVVVALLAHSTLQAQLGMTIAEFELKLKDYFIAEAISDVRQALPLGSTYRVWGWDAGDFSGDSVPDLAVSVRLDNVRKRESVVYLFVDMDGYLVNVTHMTHPYVELPLEVGVAINDNHCYVTRKIAEDHWETSGYTFANGALIHVDESVRDKAGRLRRETYDNYRNLTSFEWFSDVRSKDVFSVTRHILPCYHRGRQVVAGYSRDIVVGHTDDVVEGAYCWQGSDDASFTARAAFDDAFLYFQIAITDDVIFPAACDTCPGDLVVIHLDPVVMPANVGRTYEGLRRNGMPRFRSTAEDGGLVRIELSTGDFSQQRPTVKIAMVGGSGELPWIDVNLVKLTNTLAHRGFILRVRIPFTLINYPRVPLTPGIPVHLGCTIVYHDYDNEYRPTEFTRLASSTIETGNPSTLGYLRLLPEGKWFGTVKNMYIEPLHAWLRELGY